MSVTRRILLLIGAVFFVAAVAIGVFAVPAMVSESGQPTNSSFSSQVEAGVGGLVLPLQTLDGEWKYEKNGTAFTATVINNTVKIDLGSDGVVMNYYVGTFESYAGIGDTIKSTSLTTDAIVLSQSTAKDFQVGKDAFTFVFEAMGMKATVEMRRA
jgi:hypothetical protein